MWLHLLVLAPFVAALLMVVTSGFDSKSTSRIAILLGTVFTVFSIRLISVGSLATTPIEWFNLPGTGVTIYYHLMSQGFSAWLVFLSCFVSLIALIAAKDSFGINYKNFAIGIFALLGAMNGSFLASDAVLFFFFFEAMVLPAALLIAAYGGLDRKAAAMNFAIYTLAGSAPMALALWYLLSVGEGSSVAHLAMAYQNAPESVKFILFASFALAFLVKTPLFPFHGWQAQAYAVAPAPLSAVLTGVMSKVGVFGFIFWVIPVFNAAESMMNTIMWIGLFTAVYGALMATRATDAKKLLAFSSMGHLGLAVAGIFTFSTTMTSAVLVLLVAHGLSASAQFVLTGIAERFACSRDLKQMGGLASRNPMFGFLFGFAGIAALAVPGTAGFIGEFLILISLWEIGPLPALVAGICLVLSAVYMLRFIQAVLFGKADQVKETPCHKISSFDAAAVGILLVLLVVFGVKPNLITDSLNGIVENEVVADMEVSQDAN